MSDAEKTVVNRTDELTDAATGPIPTASSESLGTILTQRGETVGKKKFLFSVNYQQFRFSSIDGVPLKDLPTVNQRDFSSAGYSTLQQQDTHVYLRLDQFTALGVVGLTDRVDLAILIPYGNLTLNTNVIGGTFYVVNPTCGSVGVCNGNVSSSPVFSAANPAPGFHGMANGIGDVTVSLKGNVFNGERSKAAFGGDVRFPTGDEKNYLGTGAYGVKPYFIFSHKGRVTPNVNIGYQWNGNSILAATASSATAALPSSLLYSAGIDTRLNKKVTLVGEFLGQYVINGPRLVRTTATVGSNSIATVSPLYANYSMDNAGVGVRLNPYRGLLITAPPRPGRMCRRTSCRTPPVPSRPGRPAWGRPRGRTGGASWPGP